MASFRPVEKSAHILIPFGFFVLTTIGVAQFEVVIGEMTPILTNRLSSASMAGYAANNGGGRNLINGSFASCLRFKCALYFGQ